MRNIMMVTCMLMGTLLGCGSGLKVVIVKPLDQNDESLAKAIILAVANQPSTETDEQPVAKCLCGGTGRSGDGLGPCACPDGCSCKVNREEPPVVEEPPTVEEPPAIEEESVPEVEPVTETESQGSDDLTETVGRMVSVTETLADNQVKIAERFDEFDARLKAIESPVVKQVELSKTEAAKSQSPAQQLVVFGSFDGSCQGCTDFDAIDVPILINAGWTVGKDETYQIVLVNIRDEAPEKWKSGHKLAMENGIPYFAFYDGGKFVKGYAGRTSASAVADEINRIVNKVPEASTSSVQTRLPVIDHPQWGRVDLETYQKNCNCPMCQGIRAMQKEMRQTKYVAPHQEPTPDPVIGRMLKLMKLGRKDVLADLGCGDGRVLITAVKRYGCSGVGVEIDPVKADEARRLVAESGLAGKIQIITGDAREFQPAMYGVTAISAYLYPDLLRELVPQFKSVSVVASPYHQVPGMVMTESSDVWIHDTRKVVLQPSSRSTVPVLGVSFTTGKRSNGRCSKGRCVNGNCL